MAHVSALGFSGVARCFNYWNFMALGCSYGDTRLVHTCRSFELLKTYCSIV